MKTSTRTTFGAIVSLTVLSAWVLAQPQQIPVMKQLAESERPVPLSDEELAGLGDPFFTLALKERLHVTTLTELENLIQPVRSGRRTFVVSEQIADPSPGSRRAVIAFTGEHSGQTLDSNVMLSVFFDDRGFAEGRSPIEALGWDETRARYNYYKLDDADSPGRLTWKFRGSSDEADSLAPRPGTCMACHVNGAPIMKELLFPWNNWQSFKFQAAYLTPTGSPHWPVAGLPRLAEGLGSAETLETAIIDSVKRFNRRRIDRHVTPGTDGRVSAVKSARQLLKPLFVTTEFNVITATNESGLHPLRRPMSGVPRSAVAVPNSVFLNANLISGGTAARYRGLGIATAQQFSSIASVTPQEYRDLVREAGVRLGDTQGDALFAWIAPEPSHIDIDLVDQLIARGSLTPQFVAAVISVDLESPMLSPAREELLAFVPDAFDFAPAADGAPRHPDDLTRAVIASIERAGPPTAAHVGRFLARLRHEDPVQALEQDITAYQSRLRAALSDPLSRAAELRRLYALTVDRRAAILRHPVLSHLDETQGLLFPVRSPQPTPPREPK